MKVWHFYVDLEQPFRSLADICNINHLFSSLVNLQKDIVANCKIHTDYYLKFVACKVQSVNRYCMISHQKRVLYHLTS